MVHIYTHIYIYTRPPKTKQLCPKYTETDYALPYTEPITIYHISEHSRVETFAARRPAGWVGRVCIFYICVCVCVYALSNCVGFCCCESYIVRVIPLPTATPRPQLQFEFKEEKNPLENLYTQSYTENTPSSDDGDGRVLGERGETRWGVTILSCRTYNWKWKINDNRPEFRRSCCRGVHFLATKLFCSINRRTRLRTPQQQQQYNFVTPRNIEGF